MKRIAILLAVAMVTANTVGCAHRLRDWFYQGSYCSPSATPMMTAPVECVVPECCPTAVVEPGCSAPCGGQVSYGPAMSGAPYDSGAVMTPSPQTFVAPGPQ
jgi:hypothetical protein